MMTRILQFTGTAVIRFPFFIILIVNSIEEPFMRVSNLYSIILYENINGNVYSWGSRVANRKCTMKNFQFKITVQYKALQYYIDVIHGQRYCNENMSNILPLKFIFNSFSPLTQFALMNLMDNPLSFNCRGFSSNLKLLHTPSRETMQLGTESIISLLICFVFIFMPSYLQEHIIVICW